MKVITEAFALSNQVHFPYSVFLKLYFKYGGVHSLS